MRTLAVIWRTAGHLLATSAECVLEVLPPVACTPAAGTPPWIRGLFVHRGRLIPLVDVARLLQAEASPDRMMNRVLVVRVDAERAAGHWPVGLWVDSVLELDRIDFDPPPTEGTSNAGAVTHPGFATDVGRFLGPIAQTTWGQVQLVKPEEIFTPEQTDLLTQRMAEVSATPGAAA